MLHFFYKTTGFEPPSHILGLVLKFRIISDELKSVISDELNFNGSNIQLVMILYWFSYIIISKYVYINTIQYNMYSTNIIPHVYIYVYIDSTEVLIEIYLVTCPMVASLVEGGGACAPQGEV